MYLLLVSWRAYYYLGAFAGISFVGMCRHVQDFRTNEKCYVAEVHDNVHLTLDALNPTVPHSLIIQTFEIEMNAHSKSRSTT